MKCLKFFLALNLKKIAFVAFIILSSLFIIKPCNAQKDKWIDIGEDSLGNKFYFKYKPIVSFRGIPIRRGAEVQVKIICSEDFRREIELESKKNSFPLLNIYTEFFRFVINCDRKDLIFFLMSWYDKNDNIVGEISVYNKYGYDLLSFYEDIFGEEFSKEIKPIYELVDSICSELF